MKNQKRSLQCLQAWKSLKSAIVDVGDVVEVNHPWFRKKEHCEQLYRLNNYNNGYYDNCNDINNIITFCEAGKVTIRFATSDRSIFMI